MWRSFLAVILMHAFSAAQAQQMQPVVPQGSDTAPVKSSAPARPRPATYTPYTLYSSIRRGTQEDAAIRLDAAGIVVMPRTVAAGIVPLRLDLEPSEGLTISKIRYDKGFNRKFSFQDEPISVHGFPLIHFNLRADDNATLGPRVLKGKITFQLIRNDSTLEPAQQLDVLMPITVVEHDAKVSKSEWPGLRHPVGMTILLIALLPLMIPVVLVYYPICWLLGPQTCPD